MTKAKEQSVKDKVKDIAKSTGAVFDKVWRDVLFERWLARLAKSKYQNHFIFKGGMCLAKYMELNRETKDLDFLLVKLKSDQTSVQKYLTEIAAIELEDGYVFNNLEVDLLEHDHMKYPGFRVSMIAALGGTKSKLSVDLGVGDVVEPKNITIELSKSKGKPLFEKDIQLWSYTMEAIFAEKLHTALTRGAINSRMKDYHDMVEIIRFEEMKIEDLQRALLATFENRKAEIKTLEFDSDEISQLQRHWDIYRRKLQRDVQNGLPESIDDAISEINKALDAWGLI